MDTTRPARRSPALLALALAATAATAALAPSPAAGRVAAPGAPPVDVVVTSTAHGLADVAAAVQAAGGTVLARLPLVGGVHAELPAGAVLAPSYRVAADRPLVLAGGHGRTARAASAVRPALGLQAPAGQGEGVEIAVVDTGVADGPDFGDRLTHVDVTGTWEPGQSHDAYGHGTFVAGVAAGDGSGSGGTYAGVAPGASVLDVRVAGPDGSTDLSTVLRGLQAVADADVDVVNLSLSSGSPLPYQIDPLTVALENLWASGVVVVVPSGNDGPSRGSVGSPGVDPVLLTVGSLDVARTADRRDDTVPRYSGRGPAPRGVAKPDLVAPGHSLVSLRAPGSAVDAAHPEAVVDERYFRGSGTSFSSAAVAGAAAVLLQERGELSPDQVKALLRGTAYGARGLDDPREGGAGGLDLGAALSAPAPDVPAAAVAPPPGDAAALQALLAALLDGDRAAVVELWAGLSPEGRRWAASRWDASRWDASRWDASRWDASRWDASRWDGSRWSASRWTAAWG